MKRLRVLFITAWYPTKEMPVVGVFVREHAKAVQLYDDVVVLHLAGADPTLRALWRIEQEANETLTEGIPTYRVWHRRLPVPKLSFLMHLWSVWYAFRHVAAKGFRPDVIHAHVYAAGLPAVLIGKLYRIPVAVTEQSTEFPRKLLRGLSIWRARLAFEWANVVMPVSAALQQAIDAYGIKAHFQVVRNVVDTNMFYPQSSCEPNGYSKRLLVVSLLDASHKKGIPYLIQALAQLRERRDDWHVDIVGDGVARVEYECLTRDLELGDKVIFHGLKPKPEVAEFMRQADLFVLPSLFDNLPCVLVEAMASGLPIVSTLTGGIPEIIDEEVGRLVTPGDSRALCEALDYMLDDLQEYSRKQISEYANERFSPERIGGEFDTIYRSLISAKG
jgi:glycosyltransferase involved in cell wall biosynthesis